MILGVLIGFIFFIILGILLYKISESSKLTAIALLGAGIIGCLSGTISINIYLGNHESEAVVKEECNIYSLNTFNSIQGHFILGAGSINNYVSYYYYIEEDGMYALRSVDAKKVKICQTNDVFPKIVVYGYVLKEPNVFFGLGKYSGKADSIIIYIPENSIVQQYNPNVGGLV